MKPIIKWVGGKSQCLRLLTEYILLEEDAVYVEPFIGGGSVLLSCKPRHFIINDVNPNLMCMYDTVLKKIGELKERLQTLENEYNTQPDLNAKQELYLQYRREYNNIKYYNTTTFRAHTKIASLFIVLNKLGYNGIYRENTSGQFNIPFGKHNLLNIDYDNLTDVYTYFKNSDCALYCCPYDIIVNQIYQEYTNNKKVIVYLDPPYYVCDESKFVQYTSSAFSGDLAHHNLYQNINKWQKNRDWHLVVSNSYCQFTKAKSLEYELGNRSLNLTKSVGRTTATELLSYTKHSNLWKQYHKYLTGKSRFDSIECERKYISMFANTLTLDSKRDKDCFNIGKLGELAVQRVFAEHGIYMTKCPFKENVRPDGFITINNKQYIVEIKSRTYTCTGTASEKIDCIPRKLHVLYKKYNYPSIVIFVGGQIVEKSGKTFLSNDSEYIISFKTFAKNISGVEYWLSFGELEHWITNQLLL